MLLRSLSEKIETQGISFSRLYPDWLYPGNNIAEPGYEGHHEPATRYILDSINPYSWLKTLQQILALSPNAILIPWWSISVFPCLFFITLFLRKSNIPIIFLCHNVVEHENSKLRKWLTKHLLSSGSGFIVHNQQEYETLQSFFTTQHAIVHEHPIYNHMPTTSQPKLKSADNRIRLLFFGIIRHYKGLDVLLNAINLVTRDDFELNIVGEIWHDNEKIQALIKNNYHTSRITLVSRYISEQEVADYFLSSDILVAPYRSATGSGVVALAKNYNLPIIATTVGSLPNIIKHQQTGILIPPDSPEELAQTLQNLTASEIAAMSENISSEIQHPPSWDSLANTIVELATSVSSQ